MPGPYAHITLIAELLQPARLAGLFSPVSGFPAKLIERHSCCMLGAVSPDYPNLDCGNGSGPLWADAMHCTRACAMISSGVDRVRETTGFVRDKLLAWLMGYCAHLVTDVTIHPVVQAKVGVYAENQRQHRICEMHQDSYIYRRMNLGEIGDSESFALSVAQCSNVSDLIGLDRDIVNLWEGMLKDVHPELFSAHHPDISSWHSAFIARICSCKEDAVRLFPLANVIAENIGLAYPAYSSVGNQFIKGQMIPSEKPSYLHYDEIFDQAARNVAMVWSLVEQAVCTASAEKLFAFEDWNLDTGCDEHGRLVFW